MITNKFPGELPNLEPAWGIVFNFCKTFKDTFETDNRAVSYNYYPAADKNGNDRPAAPSSKISQDSRADGQADDSASRSGENKAQKHEPGEKNKKKLFFPGRPPTLYCVVSTWIAFVSLGQSQ